MEPTLENFSKLFVGREELDRLAEKALATVRKRLALRRKGLAPGLLALSREFETGKLVQTSISLREGKDREDTLTVHEQAGAGYVGTARIPVAAVQFAGAWAVSQDSPFTTITYDHPARFEVVVVGAPRSAGTGTAFSVRQT